jgi:tetratricopeptide (TPR) repeat protein
MASEERINQLMNFIKEDPNDPFLIYALAIEHLKIDKTRSLELFEDLLKNHENYIGTYYHAANLYSEMGNRDQATMIYEKGIETAKKQNEAHALKELQSAYLNFQFED